MEYSRIKTKQDLQEWLNEEKKIYGDGNIMSFLLIKETDILRRHLVLLRKTEYYVNTNNRILAAIYQTRLKRLQNRYALHIALNTCGVGLNIAHVGTIIINSDARIGKNARFHVGVNIGANYRGDKAPKLGDNIYIAPGAKLFGDIEIASNVVIGANAVVNKSCYTQGAILVGVPAKEHSPKGDAEK